VDDEVETLPEVDEFDESVIEEMEHLQLSLEEAWFLSSALGVLKIYDPSAVSRLILPPAELTFEDTYPPPASILPLFITPTPSTLSKPSLRPDDPFLVSYVAYHHFRSLGWVVKPGIKFAADWLLYRRGPVFSHSA
jgi:tRNA-splicing endonuclease subunit Sen2